ncbi:hypothetical protein DEO72_LG1g2143 [Vigna unguiculata]|uniref:Uncharacterized protein n=1 Tax=Vigna unguiculata TaxID=3917 RepID=A0A4D6KTJ9_VIGUN|nr:hypothetical protein DEO72_LG1g2143 [Vigna unguiculata]
MLRAGRYVAGGSRVLDYERGGWCALLVFFIMLCCETWIRGCCAMSGEVGSYVPCSHLRDAACGEVRSWWITCVGLRAGRFVEAGPRAGSSPYLLVFGDDRVMRYTGADDVAGGADEA